MRIDLADSRRKVAALTAPRNVVLVGASDRPGSWAARVWNSLALHRFDGPVFPINPKREELFGTRCYPDLASLPEPPDHLAILVPAAAVPGVIREAGAAGARSATVFSSGFGEAHDSAGLALRSELAAAIAATGLAVSGPNCMGNVCGRSRMVTMTEGRDLILKPGPIAMVGQSGGVLLFTNRVLRDRGLSTGYLITSGNEIDLTVADYIAFFAADPDIRVILCYIEGLSDVAKFKAACAAARDAGKPVIAVKLGQSEAGKEAAMAHTGSLAGNAQVFDAIAGELGVIRVDSLDDAVETADLLLHTGVPKGRRLGAITLSGAFRGILLDAAERNHLVFPDLAPQTAQRLQALLGVGSMVGNPLDGGYGVLTGKDTYLACVAAMDDDPNIDMLLLQEEVPREQQGNERTESYVRGAEGYAAAGAKKPIAFISLLTHGHSDYSRALRADLPHLSFLNEANKALRAIDVSLRRAELLALGRSPPSAPPPPALPELYETARQAGGTPVALNEVRSKELLRAYGIATPRETFAATAEQAAQAASDIGFPVVLKVVSASITHKSDVGGVLVGLRDAASVAAGYHTIRRNIAAAGIDTPIEGVLVCQQIGGGVELALGLHRDPEMGLVVMVGSGGVLLELIQDVAFAGPPITPDKARHMIAQTRLARLLHGYRGSGEKDIQAVVAGLVALGRLANDLGDIIEAIDINPFLAGHKGAIALDALVVLRSG